MDSSTSNSKESSATLPPNLGRFAWAVVGSTCVPCIFREDNTKYVPLRIVHAEIYRQFLEKFTYQALNTSWSDVETLFPSKAESDLLNQINKHCELVFGKDAFNESDKMVKLDDLIQYYDFLDISYKMLLTERSSDATSYKCGFLRINNDNNAIVPYVVKNNRKYLPIFYFEDETKSLDADAITLESWDLAYLKLCCKAQGIKDDIIAGDKHYVISLEQIKFYFTKDTKFDDFWPANALKTLQSTSAVEANNNHSRSPAPPASTARTQKLASPVENHFQRRVSADTAMTAPPPSYWSSVSSKKQSKWDSPPQLPSYQRTHSTAATTNSSSNANFNIATTNSTASILSRPHPPVQSVRQLPTVQKNCFDPRLKR